MNKIQSYTQFVNEVELVDGKWVFTDDELSRKFAVMRELMELGEYLKKYGGKEKIKTLKSWGVWKDIEKIWNSWSMKSYETAQEVGDTGDLRLRSGIYIFNNDLKIKLPIPMYYAGDEHWQKWLKEAEKAVKKINWPKGIRVIISEGRRD